MGNRLIWLKKLTESKMEEARSHKANCSKYEPWTAEFLESQVKMMVAVKEARAAHRKFLNITILGQEMES